ncbi:suppressor of fused domain protein [Aneurinibacillus danicus]|jgi:hypothetical protein|uniref:Antitoxin YqcF n=1 Tax=Aneurinibacillus danicus TaxID=267746 RepID=A0A511V7E3_9BACL|nr:suppressor of fused domain protein [Aneurinibacillus danicus]GEN34886.1 antitoxin YqcF [Aneurinibacillus danicus]
MSVTPEKKQIAKYIADIFGGKASVFNYGDDNNISKIAILQSVDSPCGGEVSYSTIGLSSYDIGLSVEDKPLRIEFVGASPAEYEQFGNIISTCAFNVINSDYSCSPGTIYPNIVKMYYPELNTKHILFVSPFLWDKDLETLHFEDKKVAWLQAIPISDTEFVYAQKHGSEALEDLLEESDVDILDLNRLSVI